MITKNKYLIGRTTVIVLLLLIVCSCEDMFKDPLKDKESGEDITILLLDRNFIKTKLQFWFVDSETDMPIEDELIELELWGDNIGNLITFSGEKPQKFTTDLGFLELAYDPNFVVDKNNPLEFTVVAKGINLISAPQFLSYTQDGTKDVVIKMIRLIPAKSTKMDPFVIPFDIYYNDVLHSGDLRFVADIRRLPTGTPYQYLNLYMSNIDGTILCNNLHDEVAYDDYGVYYNSFLRGLEVLPPEIPVRTAGLVAGDFVYATVLPSGNASCEEGLLFRVSRADGAPGTGNFNYLITFSDGNTKDGRITCSFPSEILIEPIHYPVADPSVVVQIFGDAQYDISNPVTLASPCSGIAEFTVIPKVNLKTFRFITQYICPGSPIGLALSTTGQFRKTDSGDSWTTFEFVEGICELQLDEGADYDFRVAIDDDYFEYTLPTDPSLLEEFLVEHAGDDYQVRELTITPDNGVIEVIAILEVSDEVCDKIGPKK